MTTYEKVRKLEIQNNIMRTALEHIAGIREHSAEHLKPHEIALLALSRVPP